MENIVTTEKKQETGFKFPTEIIELPSKGLLYPKDNPLSSGKIEMKYMTAREEDILTNQSYIQKGVVLDKLMQSLIVSKINYDDLIVGDKNAIMVAARILGYGKDYTFTYNGEEHTIDLSKLENKSFDETLITSGINEFTFVLPNSNAEITFKILSHGDEKKIQGELDGLKKMNKDNNPELSTRLKYIITSINENRDTKAIRDFVSNYLLASDSRALREYMKKVQPDVDLIFFPDGSEKAINIPIGISFFWPDVE
jgi:hypothetical protein